MKWPSVTWWRSFLLPILLHLLALPLLVDNVDGCLVATNYCDLMIIDTHLNVCHPSIIVKGSKCMDKK